MDAGGLSRRNDAKFKPIKSESHVVIVAMNLSWVSLKYFYDLVQIILNCNKFKCHAIVSSKDKGF